MNQKINPLSEENLNFIYSEILNKILEGEEINKECQLNKVDIIILAIHSIFLALDFKYKLKDNNNNNNNNNNKYKLEPYWNKSEPYEFKYTHSQSQLTFLIKSLTLNNRLLIHGTTIETNDTYTLELFPDDFIPDQIKFPFTIKNLEDVSLNKKLREFFCNKKQFEEFISEVKKKLLNKLIPGLYKEGYEETSESSRSDISQTNLNSNQRRNPAESLIDPSNLDSVNFHPPRPQVNPFGYGDRDLNPIGSGGGLVPGLPRFGGGSAIDPFGMIRDREEGGMILGPNHPIFRPHGSDNFHPASSGPARFPPGAIPPGARFDPVSPFGPRIDPNNSNRNRGRGQPFSGEPDNDELPPPGYNDMFM